MFSIGFASGLTLLVLCTGAVIAQETEDETAVTDYVKTQPGCTATLFDVMVPNMKDSDRCIKYTDYVKCVTDTDRPLDINGKQALITQSFASLMKRHSCRETEKPLSANCSKAMDKCKAPFISSIQSNDTKADMCRLVDDFTRCTLKMCDIQTIGKHILAAKHIVEHVDDGSKCETGQFGCWAKIGECINTLMTSVASSNKIEQMCSHYGVFKDCYGTANCPFMSKDQKATILGNTTEDLMIRGIICDGMPGIKTDCYNGIRDCTEPIARRPDQPKLERENTCGLLFAAVDCIQNIGCPISFNQTESLVALIDDTECGPTYEGDIVTYPPYTRFDDHECVQDCYRLLVLPDGNISTEVCSNYDAYFSCIMGLQCLEGPAEKEAYAAHHTRQLLDTGVVCDYMESMSTGCIIQSTKCLWQFDFVYASQDPDLSATDKICRSIKQTEECIESEPCHVVGSASEERLQRYIDSKPRYRSIYKNGNLNCTAVLADMNPEKSPSKEYSTGGESTLHQPFTVLFLLVATTVVKELHNISF